MDCFGASPDGVAGLGLSGIRVWWVGCIVSRLRRLALRDEGWRPPSPKGPELCCRDGRAQ